MGTLYTVVSSMSRLQLIDPVEQDKARKELEELSKSVTGLRLIPVHISWAEMRRRRAETGEQVRSPQDAG